jgi:hypothetical protein
MLYGEDGAKEAATQLLSRSDAARPGAAARQDAARLATAALRAALAGSICTELSGKNGSVFPKLSAVLPQMRSLGRAVQVDPIKPTLKAPGTKRLKLKHDEPLSRFAFKFNLRRFNSARTRPRATGCWTRAPRRWWCGGSRQGLTLVHFSAQLGRF